MAISDIFSFLFKANVCLLAFWLLYRGLFRRETFFGWNRAYLWVAGIASVLVPFVPVWNMGGPSAEPALLELPAITVTYTPDATGTEVATTGFEPYTMFAIIISSVFALVLLIAAVVILGRRFRYRAQNKGSYTLIELPENAEAFSFFRWVFIPRDADEPETILAHELAHVKEGHTWDLLFWQAIRAVFWFNPVAWLMLREVRVVHEFTADQHAVQMKSKEGYATLLLSQALHTSPQILANSFSHQTLINKRIMMLHKSPSKSGARLKYLAVPALVLALVGFASCTKDFDEKAAVTAASTQTTATAQEDPVYKVVEEMPTFNGGQEAMFAYFGDNFKYPKSAKEAGLEGKVIVSFIVDQVGKVTDAKVVKGFDPACDQAALEFVAAMPDWIPGEQGGKAVKVQMALPIQFKLD